MYITTNPIFGSFHQISNLLFFVREFPTDASLSPFVSHGGCRVNLLYPEQVRVCCLQCQAGNQHDLTEFVAMTSS